MLGKLKKQVATDEEEFLIKLEQDSGQTLWHVNAVYEQFKADNEKRLREKKKWTQ